ncbi:MAG: glycoside hydrolase family 13 protein [Clostridiales bacterium]|nr:glycoside hydrolase family 13 protein [Clostridiales bacterium]
MNMEAVFSDETENFVKPFCPAPGDTVTVKIRAAQGDVEKASLHTCETLGEQRRPLVKSESDGNFDYFSARITVSDEPLRYYFTLEKGGRLYYYNKRGLYDTVNPDYHFRLIPGHTAPDWARGAVMYQIYVDRFCNGDTANDVVDYEYLYLSKPARFVPWSRDVVPDDFCNFYGGDLRGVMEKMAYLKSLGVEAVYLNPVFVSPSNHKYDIQDYDHVDPHLGVIARDGGDRLAFEKFNNRYATRYMRRTVDIANLEASDKLLADLIALAHENGIRVILDGVFNHCGSFNKWLDKAGFYAASGSEAPGAYRDENSPYHDYFLWYDRDWPNNDCYDGWWGNENHPKLNYEASPALYDYIMGIARKWVSPPHNADGWRLDVAADLGRSPAFNHKFWRDFRRAVKEANPQAIILAEHYGDSSPWINGGEWDTVMNYDAFMDPVTWFLTGVSKHSDESRPHLRNDALALEGAMRFHMSRMNIHALQTAMNELSNHDHSRFLTRTNRATGRLHTEGARAAEKNINKNVMMEAVVIQMTWPGAPTVYYGDEAGLTGWTDPDNRRPFPWGAEDALLLSAHRVLISLRKKYPALRTGSFEYLHNSDGFISYGRWDENNRIAVAVNNTDTAKEARLPVWKIGCGQGSRMECVAGTFNGRVVSDRRQYFVRDGMVRVTVPAEGALVLAQ